MEYRRIRISYTEAKDRFYRVLDIREDLNLVYVGVIICTSLSCEFEHNFMFRSNRKAYVPESFMSDGFTGWIPMKEHSLKDLGDYFLFEYDTGDGWEFDCETIGKYEKEDKTFAYLVEGKGQGIWEDNKYSLDMYLAGLVPAMSAYDPKNSNVQLPWNFENECFEDFEDFDLAEESDCFEDFLLSDINEYLHGYHQHGFEKDVKYVDPELYFAGEDPFVRYLDFYEDEGPVFTEKISDDETPFDPEDEKQFLAESFVQMQIDSYMLIADMMEQLRKLYPESDDEELMESVREELIDRAYVSLDEYLSDPDEDFEEEDEEEYH